MQENISQKLPMQLVGLTPIQKAYYLDEQHRIIVTASGRRARKTLIGKRKTLNRSLRKVGRYFHGAPTFNQAKSIFWDSLVRDTALFRSYKSESNLFVRLLNGSEIHVVGLDKPERIEGQPWHGCHITEFGNLKSLNVWTSNIRPVLSDTNGWALLEGVPEGRNFYYDLALKACNGALPVTQAGIGSFAENDDWAYYHWFSSDVLNAEEIESARQDLDERTFRQEYEGSFESYEGAAYKEFGLHNIDSAVKQEEGVISIGMDFNVDPMTAVVGRINGDSFNQFDEIWLNNSNTFEMRDEILKRYGNPRMITIYPDSTGDSSRSNATKSDIQILKDAGFAVRARTHNPEQRDRINTINSFMKKRYKVRYKINPKTCPKTINDLNKRQSMADGRLDKQQEKEQKIGHISDALGYLVYYNFPLVRGKIEGIRY